MIPGARSAALVLLLVAGAQPDPEKTPLAGRYREVVEAYRGGRAGHSVEMLLALDQDSVRRVVNNLAARAGAGLGQTFDEGFFEAAAALHTDAAVACWTHERQDEGWSHLDLAQRLVDVSEPRVSKPGSFRRRWYAAAALLVAGHAAPHRALEYFDDAVERLPDDVPLLTAAGWFSERVADGAAAEGASLRNSEVVRRRHLRAAEGYLTAAVEADPRAEEPALRLARIETLMGRDARASGRLTALIARDDLVPFTAYLARLFLGGIRAREDERAAAERLFKEALALHPIAQSARVALADVLYAGGDSAGAAAIVEPLATPAAGRDRNDPWSDYQLAYPQVGILLLDELRDEVQQ